MHTEYNSIIGYVGSAVDYGISFGSLFGTSKHENARGDIMPRHSGSIVIPHLKRAVEVLD